MFPYDQIDAIFYKPAWYGDKSSKETMKQLLTTPLAAIEIYKC